MSSTPQAVRPAKATGRQAHSPISPLAGAWSTIYSNQLHREQMQIPNILPAKTLGIFHFNPVNAVRGELRPNLLGRVSSVITFDGTYTLFRDKAFGLLEGFIDINLPGPTGTISKNRLFIVLRTKDEIDWVLTGSDDPARVVVAGGKMFRIKDVPFDPPGDSGPALDPSDLEDLKPDP